MSGLKELQDEIKAAGLLSYRGTFYVWNILLSTGMLIACWAAIALIGASWWQLAWAVVLAFIYVQIGHLGHDTGHQQVMRSLGSGRRLGYVVGNLLIGVSAGWWTIEHNRHHSFPNDLRKDPDIILRPILYDGEDPSKVSPGLHAFIVRHQGLLYFPLLALDGFAMRLLSLRAIVKRKVQNPGAEMLCMLAHIAAYSAAVFAIMPAGLAIAFIIVHNFCFGAMAGALIAPNHKGMPVHQASQNIDWMSRQLLTSRNLPSNWLVDFIFGGLNYQIEHHLFPRMPRPNLRKARLIVKEYCARRNLPYCESGVFEAYAEIVKYFKAVGIAWLPAQAPPAYRRRIASSDLSTSDSVVPWLQTEMRMRRRPR